MPRLKAAQRREQLMAVATRLFAKSGYDATTTWAIAEAAGVTEPILYRHFRDKRELFVAITRQVSEQTLEHWRELTGPLSDPAEKLRAIARGFPEHLRGLSDAYHVIHGALATSTDRKVLGVMREHYQQIEDFFVDLIEQGKAAHSFKPDIEARGRAWHLIHLGIGYAMISLNLPQFDGFAVGDSIELVIAGLQK